MSTIVENINPISVEIEPKHSVTSQTGAIVNIEAPEYAVAVQRKEYKVVGDNIYIPRLYDDAPQWMKDLIGTVVDIKTAVAVGNLDDALEALRTLSDELDVAKNTYTLSIVSSNDINTRINTAIETLNSALLDADATILNIAQTATTPEEASAIAINTLSASLSEDGEIGSFISNMNAAFADLDSATTESINLMESALEAEFSANATAINTIRTYVGVDEDGNSTGTGLLADVEILQKQNDGIIETVSGEWNVMLNTQDPDMAQLVVGAEPYASWKALDVSGIDTRLSHIGDVYIKYSTTTNGAKEYIASYKFIKTAVDTTSPYSTDTDGFTWALVIDQAAQDAYEQALNAYDLADGKRRVFVDTPYVPYDIGDLWVRVVNGSSQIWRCNESSLSVYSITHWQLASTDDNATIILQTGLENGTANIKLSNAYVDDKLLTTYISDEIDKEVVVYSGTASERSALTGMKLNDIFIEKTTETSASGVVVDVINTYKYSGTAWVKIGNNNNLTALADLADGKRTIFSNNTSMPTNPKIRDMWIPSGNYLTYVQGEVYLYNGTAWVVATRYTADIATLSSNIQSQIDGKVDTYYQATVPFANATNVSRRTSAGDYWYCTSTAGVYVKGKMYKYVESANGSNWNYTWTETADITKYAFDTADSKAAIYTTSNKPSTYNVRDMLIVITDNAVPGYSAGVMLTSTVTRTSGGFTNADWTKLVNDTEDLDDFVNSVYTPTINSLQTQVDAKIEYWFQSTDPKSAWTTAEERLKHNGDVWHNTTTKVSQYYSSQTNSWNIISDKDALDAIAAAEAARQLADSKVVVRYGTAALRDSTSAGWTAAEKTSNIGDIWIISDTGNDQYKQFRWTGTAWLDVRDKKIIANADAITQLGVDITSEAGLRVAGDTAVTNTVKAYADDVGAGIESKWEYGSTLNINGQNYISGFGLVSSSTSGVIGAPVSGSEFWISADKFKLSASGGKGSSYTPFSVNATTGDITFKGKVTFGSNQSGTIEEAIASTIETVQVGDKNINITDNLIPITSLVSDTNNASYQFTGTPTKSNASGIDSFAEPQIMLDETDEVYSPYVDEVTIPYYFRVGIKGITSLDRIKICTIDSVDAVTYGTLTYTMNDGEVIDSGSWYIVDGIINPVGGNTTASGSIRKSDGTKIGTINNYPIPSGALRIILGFVSDCTISRIKLAKITADTLTGNYVTQDYVDSSIANKSSSATKNEMAVAMGFTDYDAMVAQFVLLGSTIINGGYINTGLLEANSILASKINTTGLIAENISANEIIGKNIEGGRIIGARIEGAVIKASYLDLNGELEVLTNFIITIAMYNANPSLYNDAVYISADNQYRIPTLSIVSEPFKNYTTLSMNSSVYGTLRPYNSANVGHNLKAVKIRPIFQNTPAEFLILTIGLADDGYNYGAVAAELYIDGTPIVKFNAGTHMDGSGKHDGFFIVTGYVNYSQGIYNENHHQVDITGIPVLGTVRCIPSLYETSSYDEYNGTTITAMYTWKISLVGGDGGELPLDWNSGRISIKRVSGAYSNYRNGGQVQARLNGISINNMI